MFDPARRTALAGSFLTLTLLLGCVEESNDPIPGNLLVGVKAESSGVPNTTRLVDGELPIEGDHWDSALTARFDSAAGSVTWDLGAPRPIKCGLVQGDNNDVYLLSGSADGKTWQPIWQAPPVEGAGMRTRQSELEGNARYLRMTARDGDQLFSVGEIAVWSECPKGWPKIALNRIEGVPPTGDGSQPASSWSVSLGVLVAAAVILMVLSRKRRPPAPEPDAGASANEPPAP
jgi:hypothetical protein